MLLTRKKLRQKKFKHAATWLFNNYKEWRIEFPKWLSLRRCVASTGSLVKFSSAINFHLVLSNRIQSHVATAKDQTKCIYWKFWKTFPVTSFTLTVEVRSHEISIYDFLLPSFPLMLWANAWLFMHYWCSILNEASS